MKIIPPSFEIEPFDGKEMLKRIERAGRTCYKSEGAITPDSCFEFVRKILKSGHESVIEHEKITVRIICDRGVTHELVRHRLVSYSQESTRYCNYSQNKFGGELTFIDPRPFLNEEQFRAWEIIMGLIERKYLDLVGLHGCSPQMARSVLPNSLKTEIVTTANLREWRHILRLRTSPKAHPQMRQIMIPLLLELDKRLPIVFEDIVRELG